MTRFLIMNAGPIDYGGVRYKNLGDRQPLQEYDVAQWQVDLNARLQELNKKYPDYKILCFGRAYVMRYFYSQLLYDVLWSNLSTALVHICVTWHTQSLFVGSTSMSMILFAFPITLVIYRNVMQVTNLSSLHLMVIFLVLGIAADNIFVLWDAWR